MEVSTNKDTFGYLGPAFQIKVLWRILVNLEFGNEIISHLHSKYFDIAIQKKFLSIIKKYYSQNKKVPQLSNKSMAECINASHYSDTEREELHGTLKRIFQWDQETHNGVRDNDGDVVQKNVWLFVKQQEYRSFADKIIDKIKTGTLEENIHDFEDSIKKMALLGAQQDFGKEIFDDVRSALKQDYRNPIPTGIGVVDRAMIGGLGSQEIGIILAALGVGKTTILTKIANTAFNVGKNVAHIVFEDTVDSIRRKHYAIWSKVPLSQFTKEREDEIYEKVTEHQNKLTNGRLVIKKMSQEDVTIPYIKSWILNYEKSHGIKFDIVVLDYIDCVESHKPTGGDDLKAELIVIKAFEAMAAELNIPCWTAAQGNRSSISAEFVQTDQMGGSIKKAQKTHFLMSLARSIEQKQNNTANMQILKARFAKDGLQFENAIFNNDTLEIRGIEYHNTPKAEPFKQKKKPSVGTLDNDMDNKMKQEYEQMALKIGIDDFESRLKPKDVEKKSDEEKKSEETPPSIDNTNTQKTTEEFESQLPE